MITLTTLIVLGTLALVGLTLIGLPLMLLIAILPGLLTIAGVILTVKALMDKPVLGENFYPAAACLVMSALLRWIF